STNTHGTSICVTNNLHLTCPCPRTGGRREEREREREDQETRPGSWARSVDDPKSSSSSGRSYFTHCESRTDVSWPGITHMISAGEQAREGFGLGACDNS